ncbi:hypothetical protein [Lactobacillus sp. Sy-1]|uniref:hypothetical protein n=1 Tax=Lactobacillus sp. Sy-1 TaxID=2109645 RepID=UPI001C5A837E|nr:hypothetical protein [Lactobacillus sp. Sy-1]MBW1606214.1 hypothetical protein [Lactobacillus sp. Sy-1]
MRLKDFKSHIINMIETPINFKRTKNNFLIISTNSGVINKKSHTLLTINMNKKNKFTIIEKLSNDISEYMAIVQLVVMFANTDPVDREDISHNMKLVN